MKEYLNRSVQIDSLSRYKTVTVFIDQFRIDDEKFFKYSFRFISPTSEDSSIIFRIASKFPRNKESSFTLNETIDLGLNQCLDSFFVYDTARSRISASVISNEEKKIIISGKEKEININSRPSVYSADTSNIEEISIEKYPSRIRLSSFCVGFLSGEKIETGVQAYYSTGSLKHEDDKLLFGYGFGILYYDINNRTKFIDGFHFSAVFPLFMQYYFTGYKSGLYTGALIRLTAGQEKINYGYSEKTTFFFGPTFEPYAGIKIANFFSFDGGFYLLKFFGSEMLPDDYGFRFNINFWF